MLFERGIVVSYETIRRWGKKFGPEYAQRLRRKPPRPNDIWHLDEVVISIVGKKQGMVPKRIVTDKLASYGAARRQVMPSVEHRSHKRLNNRAENSHVPLRKRERVMQGFRYPGGLQRLTSVLSAVKNLFLPFRSHQSALAIHFHRLRAMAGWKAASGLLA
jgi:putative transposase